MAEVLPYRVCDLCGGVDDHPRHVLWGDTVDTFAVDQGMLTTVDENLERLVKENEIGVADAMRIARDFANTTSQDRHKDCCAAAGCPTGTCGPQVEAAGGAKGAKLRSSIMKNAEE